LTDAHQKVRSFLSSCMDALKELAQLLLEKEVIERPALQSILKAKMTKDAREVMQQGHSPSDGGPIGKPA
jgi:ATP-dependent Zn protease